MIVEIIGIFATLFVVASMCFKTTSIKGSIYMRVLNIVGSLIFVIYGILLPAYSTGILNAVLVGVNTYHLVKLLKTTKESTENNVAQIEK